MMRVREGVVVEAGPGFVVGQEVLLVSQAPCLACDECQSGRESFCLAPHRLEADQVPSACARVKPHHLAPERSSWLEPLARALHGLSLVACDETIAVQGDDCQAAVCRLLAKGRLASEEAGVVAVCDGDLETAQWRVAKGGTMLLFAAGPEPVALDTTRLHYEQLTIQAVRGFRHQDIEEALRRLTGESL